MIEALAKAIVNGWIFAWLFAGLWFVFMAVFVPIWMVGLLARLNNITKELRRLNDRGGGDEASQPDIAPERTPSVRQPSLGHQLLR